MRAQKGYLASKGVKTDQPHQHKPTSEDVKRWKALIREAEIEEAKHKQEAK